MILPGLFPGICKQNLKTAQTGRSVIKAGIEPQTGREQ
jgi:hypothetical protein